MLGETQNEFSLTSAALSTSGRTKSDFLSVVSVTNCSAVFDSRLKNLAAWDAAVRDGSSRHSFQSLPPKRNCLRDSRLESEPQAKQSMNARPKTHVWLLLWPGLLLLASCTSVTKPKALSTTYLSTEKIPLKIALNITDELRKANWELEVMGSREIMEVGPTLAKEVTSCARNTFIEVVEISNGSVPPAPVDAILTPNVASIDRKPGQTLFSKDAVTIAIQWTLIDPSQKLLWEGAAAGQGMNGSGWASVLTQAIEKSLRKSQFVMLSSQSIQQFAAKKYSDAKLTPVIAGAVTRPEVRDLCAMLDSEDKGRVKDSLKKLRTLNATEAVPQILLCLLDSEPNVVRESCRTLAVLGNKQTIIYLEPLLKEMDGGIQSDARKAIETLRAK